MKRLISFIIFSVLLCNTTSLERVFAQNSSMPIIQQYIVVVKNGDNLYRLSKKYETTIQEFKKMNHLKSNTIYVGQHLKTNISDCTKLIIPFNKEVNTFWDKNKNLIVATWYDDSKKSDVQAILPIKAQNCSASVKKLISHVKQTN